MSDNEPLNSEQTVIVTARVGATDVVRLDQVAARRGVDRSELIAKAIDEFLAHEGLSGRFITPPPPMQLPRRDRARTWRRPTPRLSHR